MTVSKRGASQIRGSIGFIPCDVVENMKSQLLQQIAALINTVIRAANPNRAGRF